MLSRPACSPCPLSTRLVLLLCHVSTTVFVVAISRSNRPESVSQLTEAIVGLNTAGSRIVQSISQGVLVTYPKNLGWIGELENPGRHSVELVTSGLREYTA